MPSAPYIRLRTARHQPDAAPALDLPATPPPGCAQDMEPAPRRPASDPWLLPLGAGQHQATDIRSGSSATINPGKLARCERP